MSSSCQNSTGLEYMGHQLIWVWAVLIQRWRTEMEGSTTWMRRSHCPYEPSKLCKSPPLSDARPAWLKACPVTACLVVINYCSVFQSYKPIVFRHPELTSQSFMQDWPGPSALCKAFTKARSLPPCRPTNLLQMQPKWNRGGHAQSQS